MIKKAVPFDYKKRLLDLFIASALSIPAAVICLFMAPLVWIDTRANPIFLQERVGRNGKNFQIVKVRTMRADTPDAASHEISATQITGFGSLLRKFKLDELPQIYNILKGEMSFVGPRPCLPAQRLLIEERQRQGVDVLRPGITGLSQLAGIDMSQPRKLAVSDARYLDGWSLRGDLELVFATAIGGGRGDAALRREKPY